MLDFPNHGATGELLITDHSTLYWQYEHELQLNLSCLNVKELSI